jgi:hypothetical protein
MTWEGSIIIQSYEFLVLMKQATLIKMGLIETYRCISSSQWSETRRYFLSPLLFNFALEYVIRKVKEN